MLMQTGRAMNSVYGTIQRWTRRATTSFAELRVLPWERSGMDDDDDDVGNGLIYRLKHWPELPTQTRTAGVLRTLSVMSSRPVNRHWIVANSRLRVEQVDRLLKRLVDQDAVEVI